jgi:uridine kinase
MLIETRTDEVLIAVMGATGSGKSTFISTLVEEDVGVGHGLKSGKALA